jgi:hypothetical protein
MTDIEATLPTVCGLFSKGIPYLLHSQQFFYFHRYDIPVFCKQVDIFNAKCDMVCLYYISSISQHKYRHTEK